MRDAVDAFQRQTGGLGAEARERGSQGPHHQVGLVAGHARAFAADLDVQAAGRHPRADVVDQVDGQAQGVEPGSEIGAGGRHLHGRFDADR